MYYVIQENLFQEYNYKNLIVYLDKHNLSYETVRYRPFTNELNVKTDRKDVFLFGSINAGKVAEAYGWNPGHLINDNFDFEMYMEKYKDNMLNSDADIMSIEDWEVESSNVAANEFFARPTKDTKSFSGQTFTLGQWKHWLKELTDSNIKQGLSEETKVLFAPIKSPIQQEIRCWIVKGKPVTISQYKIGNRANFLNMDNNEEAVLFATQMAKLYSPAQAFCLDICLYEDEYKIVELGCINHCGFYDANMGKIIQALEELYPNTNL